MPSRTPHQGSRPGRTPAAARSAGAAPTVALEGRGLGVAGIDDGHGPRLLRSHAGAIGDPLPARVVRVMLAVSANQLPAGGAGPRPAVITAGGGTGNVSRLRTVGRRDGTRAVHRRPARPGTT